MWDLDADRAVPSWRPGPPGGAVLSFSTRLGGVSAPPFDTLNLGRSAGDRPADVAENRRRYLESLGIAPYRLATAGQVHGVRIAGADSPGHHPSCDALLTRAPGVALAITTADCIPLLYVATGPSGMPLALAAVHSGWRGTAAGLPAAVLRELCAAASVPPGRVRVHIGPCIRSCCYEVGPDVAERFPASARSTRGASIHLDLVGAARLALAGAGLPDGAVEDIGACTACWPDLYFSHRRDAGRTGRHWAVAMLPEAAP